MAGELSSILKDIVGRAAKAPANANSGEIARMRRRYEHCTQAKVVLVDVSSSMADLIGLGDTPKIEHCRIALKDLLTSHPDMIVIAFGSIVKRLKSPDELATRFNLWGGTDLAAAIEEAILLKPSRTIIISDGMPTGHRANDICTDACDRLTGRIDCVYCGPDNHPAVEFLQSLARKGGGAQMTFDGCLELSPMIRGLLGPA